MKFRATYFAVTQRALRTLPAVMAWICIGVVACPPVTAQVGLPDAPTANALASSPPATMPQSDRQEARTGNKTAPPEQPGRRPASTQPDVASIPNSVAITGMRDWQGLTISSVSFAGVDRESLKPLPDKLGVQPGEKLAPEMIRESLRLLYATGLYQTIEVEGVREGDQVAVNFRGQPRSFIGTVNVQGVKDDRLNTVLERSARLTPGTRFTLDRLERGQSEILETLRQYGFYQSKVTYQTHDDPANSQVNITYIVQAGKQARVGDVNVEGEAGMTLKKFRKRAKLKEGSKVDNETTSRALGRLHKVYQKNSRLEAEINQDSAKYEAPVNHVDYGFTVERGPVVSISVEGVKISHGKLRSLIPIYEEGTVDMDLLNEGNTRLRDYLQRKGYFDVEVTSEQAVQQQDRVVIVFHVKLGELHRVNSVTITGNHYFTDELISEHLQAHRADQFERHGVYSEAVLHTDSDSIAALYESNGFLNVKVTPQVQDVPAKHGNKNIANLDIHYEIQEGIQQKIGNINIEGSAQLSEKELRPMMGSLSGQPYNSSTVLADRDMILSQYLSRGFSQAAVVVAQKPRPQDNVVDLVFKVNEGEQLFIRKVIITGLHYTRPQSIEREITIHAGQPLDQTAVYETQRRLYDVALFNEVSTSVQNPNGHEHEKNVLLQLKEARRWDISYGFGFEAQTGQPQRNCLSTADLIQLGIDPSTYRCSPNGSLGASPRVLMDITRSNLFGRSQTVSLRANYGLLEQKILGSFQAPRLVGDKSFDLTVSGGYSNTQDVTTYAASRLEGSIRLTQHILNENSRLSKANTFIYQFSYRRVKVDPNSIQVSVDQIPLLSQPARVGGPGVTWLRDTRDAPLDAHSGTFTSVTEFLAGSFFGSQANFNRIDITNSNYYTFGSRKWVFARNTRYGQERVFGPDSDRLIPLPERLYAGGATSHRGFAINQAGPRDSQTGYPIGGAGVFVNTFEIRTPAPTLPYVGNSLGFVLFHDMGNVFKASSDIWPSFSRFHQPNRAACRNLTDEDDESDTAGSSCSFNYFSHAVGLGLRYKTPVGPVRIDFSYNMNPPIFPVIYDYDNTNAPPHVGQADHFNFFFSLGQSF